MAFAIADGDVLRVTARLRDGYGSDIMNVFHYVYDGSTTDSAAVGTDVFAHLDDTYAEIQPAIPSDTSFIDLDLTNVTKGLVGTASAWPTMTVGGGTGDQMPSKDTALCVGRTNVPKTVGRKFLGPFIEADNADGVWNSSLTSALADFLTGYLADIAIGAVGSVSPVVAKYIAGALSGYTRLGSGYTSNGIYSQRRRRPGVGA